MPARTLSAKNVFRVNPGYHINLIRSPLRHGGDLHDHEGFSELVWVRKGPMQHSINGARHRQGRGCLTYIREHDVHAIGGGSFEMVNVAFPTAHLERLGRFVGDTAWVRGIVERTGPVSVSVPPGGVAAIEEALERLFACYASAGGGPVFARFLLTAFLLLAERGGVQTASAELPAWLARTLAWIETRLGEDLRVRDVFAAAGKSDAHVSRSFRKHLGLSPSGYLNERRLEKSRLLLTQTNYAIVEICYRVGFNNLSYFYRLFKDRYGTTPRQHRRLRAAAGLGLGT
ncbi:MAG: helix-turn-helix domain-containing protein [Kiritimatiellae bacterium]|nr:helix-turn-helix domain-containing protein [Kiritimatiellia bacterium]